jgi:hypothetical protein
VKQLNIDETFDELLLIAQKLDEDMMSGRARGEKHVRLSDRDYTELVLSSMTLMKTIGADVHYEFAAQLLHRVINDAKAEVGFVMGLLISARRLYSRGFYVRTKMLATADAMSDVLEQADSLLENNYRAAACVLVGTALETTLKKLLEEEVGMQQGYLGLKRLNEKLHKQSLYDKVTFDLINTWSDVRNSAAHGDETQITPDRVRDFTAFVRDFISRIYSRDIR